MKKILMYTLIALWFVSFSPLAHAQTTPTFPMCANPQGAIKVSYNLGTHGIPGHTTTYTGSDTVYTLSESTLVQCFCPDDGEGIQTNWWKIDETIIQQLDYFKKQGWIYIPNGLLWGLDSSAYLAKNSTFGCNFGNGTGGGPISEMNILGLADTGGVSFTYITGLSGIALVVFGLIRFFQKR